MFGQSSVLFLVCLSSSVCSLIAFTPSPSQIRHHTRFGMSNDDDEKETEIPCLPPIGESSFKGEVTNNDSEVFRIGSEKFELQYTCNVCETRNFHKVSRMAYRNGIVITVCKKCLSKHLIADNLGWTKYVGGFDEDNNIEEFMASHGRGDEVNRVSKEVFDLEGILKTNPDPGLPTDEEKGFE